jgi:Ni,Fe-hydrogenase III small subunit/NAD-dependent dihydropyrimidine dehydrogenase PreA subunit
MFELLKLRIIHGNQAIPDIRKAGINEKFRGMPLISSDICSENCKACKEICPSSAIKIDPVSIDMGKCIFCGDCVKACESNKIKLTSYHKTATTDRDLLIVDCRTAIDDYMNKAIRANKEIKRIFKRSLKLRQVSAGGCNGCEMELGACSNVNFDMSRFGIEFTASPRHADGIVITGPVSENMAYALKDTYLSVPEPKIVIAAGACAISGGIFSESPAVNRGFFKDIKVNLYIPGCPVHPLTIINGIIDLLTK